MTFLPPRISIVSSIGISTRPILSWSVNASTRLSKLSLTFFSKPEYVWMMYHCIAIGFYNLSDAKNFEYVRNAALHQPIDHGQEDSEERYGRNDDSPSRDDFLAARQSNLLHLQPDVVQKFSRFRNRAANLSADLSCPGA